MARYDEELNSAAGMSVDDILREFYAEQQSASSVPPKTRPQRKAAPETGRSAAPAPQAPRPRREADAPAAPRRRGSSAVSAPSPAGQRRPSKPARQPAAETRPAADVDAVLEEIRELVRPSAVPETPPAPPARPRVQHSEETIDISHMTIDDIISEFKGGPQATAPAASYKEKAPAAPKAPGAKKPSPLEDAIASISSLTEEAAAPARPKARPEPAPTIAARKRGSVSSMEEEARRLIAEMESGGYEGFPDEAEYEAPAPEAPAAEAPDPFDLDRILSHASYGAPAKARRPASVVTMEPEDEEEDAPDAVAESAAPGYSDEIDPRFNLGGTKPGHMVYGGRDLDLSADEDYTPPKAASDSGYHWAAGEGEERPAPPEEEGGFFARLLNLGKRRGGAPRRTQTESEAPVPASEDLDGEAEHYDEPARAEVSGEEEAAPDAAYSAAEEREEAPRSRVRGQSFRDSDAAPAAYAMDRDYTVDEEGEPLDDPNAFPSFGQYLLSLVSGLLVRLRGTGATGDGATMSADDEDLGPEVPPAKASKYYGSHVHSLRLRWRISLVLLVVLAWVTLGLPVTGMLRTIRVAAALCLAIQLMILLLSLDVVTTAAVNLARLRFGADSLAVLCCVLTSFDALAVALGGMGSGHMPLCLISSLSLMGVLLSSLLSARGLRKSLRVPAIGKRCYAVTGENNLKGSGLTLLKSNRPASGFVRRSEEAGPDEMLFHRLSPVLLLLSLLLTVIVVLAKKAGDDFLYILTAILCPATPLAALLCFALPFFSGSMRIFTSGAAIAGWSGLCDVGQSQNLIVTDRDLFPEGSVSIDTIRIFADSTPEKIISYAGTMIAASGSGLSSCFAELMTRNGCAMCHVEDFEYLPGGGMKGLINGETVLCGGTELMRLMNVRIPYRLVGKTTVLLAVDGLLYGIFNMKYEPLPQVRYALVGLIRSNRHPIFAIRDFLVTPEMLRNCFDVATDGYDFPPYVERFAISEAKPSRESLIAAVVCREGLGPLVHMADTGRSMYVATRINLLITVLAAVLGVFVVFLRFLSLGAVSPLFLLIFMLLWTLPVVLTSLFLRF